MALFLTWLGTAWAIFQLTMGGVAPAAPAAFVRDVLFTAPGQTMIVVGMGVGFVFALLAMMISVVSFPMLLDRDAGLDTAIRTRLRNQVLDKVYEANPIEVPKTMIEEAVQEIRQDTLRRIGMQNAAQLPSNDSLLEPGKKRAAMRLLVGELMQAANLTLDRARVNERLDEMLGDYPNADDLRRQYVQNADLMRRIEASVMEDQLIDWIVGQAMVLEIPSTFSDITLFGKGPAA